jgi:hypothetical protein
MRAGACVRYGLSDKAKPPPPRLPQPILPTNQVSKMFSPDIAQNYIVVENAIYPKNGALFDV